MDDIARAAARWGVETSYYDARGELRSSPPEALGQVVRALAVTEPCPAPIVLRDGRDSLEAGARAARSDRLVLIAPPGAYQPVTLEHHGVWLLAVQLYGVRSRRNWGIGDLTDLAMLLQISASAGAAGIALNPLHALVGGQASP